MRNKIRPISLILLLAILGFMLASISCTSVITSERQAQLDQAAEKYEATTGITPAQTGGLLFKWFGDYNEAKAANTPPLAIPAQSAK
jgi:hypothetical protein